MKRRKAQLLPDGHSIITESSLPQRMQETVLDLHGLSGMYYPQPRTAAGGYILRKAEPRANGLPLPPVGLRAGYGVAPDGEPDDEAFLDSGRRQTNFLRRWLDMEGFGFHAGQCVLELGCATGRMLRWFEAEAAESEYWGVDVDAESIAWCQAHLSPPFHFLMNTTAPHLPFEDRWFDLIYAGSVFTHIAELADAWFLELRRLLKSGGLLYVTILDDVALAICQRDYPQSSANRFTEEFDAATGVLSSDYLSFSFMSSPRNTRIVYCREALLEKLGRWFDVRRVKDAAYGWQTGLLLCKR